MEIQDFQYMRRGKFCRPLYPEDAHLLKPVEKIKSKKHDRALLLLHGFSSSPAVFRLLLPNIENYDYIIAPVLPGHAESIHAFAKSKYRAWLNNSLRWADTLCGTYKTVDILGLSLGGLLAYKVAEQFNINHLYLLAPAFKLKTYNIHILKHLVRWVKYLGVESIPNKAGNLYTNINAELTYKRLPFTVLQELLSFISSFDWKEPNCKTDIILGAHDTVIDSEAILEICSNWHNTNIHMLNKSAHVLPLDGDIQYIIDILS